MEHRYRLRGRTAVLVGFSFLLSLLSGFAWSCRLSGFSDLSSRLSGFESSSRSSDFFEPNPAETTAGTAAAEAGVARNADPVHSTTTAPATVSIHRSTSPIRSAADSRSRTA
jgi:hypothetical protein